MASLSSIHHAIARLQAVSLSPLPPELVCIGPLRCALERKLQAHTHFKKPLPTSTFMHSALRSKLLIFATAAGQDAATSTLVVQEVDFVWKGEGSQVLLTGDFLSWDAKLTLAKGADGAFHCKQKLSPGTYKYKYIIDGEWAHSPDSPMIEDGKGGFNNQITVTEASSVSANMPNSKPIGEDASVTARAKGMVDSSLAAKDTTNSPAAAKVSTDAGGSPKAASKPTPTADVEGLPKAASKPTPAAKPAAASKPTPSTDVEGSPKAAFKLTPAADVEGSPKAASKLTPAADVEGSPKAASKPTPAASKPTPAAKPAKKVDKPYPQIIIEDVIPKIKTNLQKEQDISDVNVVFQDNQLEGSFIKKGIIYTFWAFFPDGKLEGSRGFSLSSHGAPPSTVEPFLIDEKKITADLLVFWVSLYYELTVTTACDAKLFSKFVDRSISAQAPDFS